MSPISRRAAYRPSSRCAGQRGVLLWHQLRSDAGAGYAVAKVLADRLARVEQQAPRRCPSHRPSRRQLEPSGLFPVGRAGELSEVSGELPLVTFAEVAPDNAALRRHHRPGVCNPYIRLAPETRGEPLPLRTTCGSTRVRATGTRQRNGEAGAASREADADHTWLVGLHFRNANPDTAADLVLRLALAVRPLHE